MATNTFDSNIREYLPVYILNSGKNIIKEIYDICKNEQFGKTGKTAKNDKDVKAVYEKMKALLSYIFTLPEDSDGCLKEVKRSILEGISKMHKDFKSIKNPDEFGSYQSSYLISGTKFVDMICNILKGAKTALDIKDNSFDLINKHPVAANTKFKNFYKAFVTNNESLLQSIVSPESNKLNPPDLVLLFGDGPIESKCETAKYKDYYAFGVSLKSVKTKNGNPGFKNPGAATLSQAIVSQLKEKDIIPILDNLIKSTESGLKEIAVDSAVCVESPKVATRDEMKQSYKAPGKINDSYNTFQTTARLLGRAVQSQCRDILYDVYKNASSTKEKQHSFQEHIFNFWFGLQILTPQFIVYQISDTGTTPDSLSTKIINWTQNNISNLIGDGDYSVRKKGIDGIEVITSNGKLVFDCRFKYSNGLAISSMKMSASQTFGKNIKMGNGTGVNAEINLPMSANGTVDLKSIKSEIIKAAATYGPKLIKMKDE